jgi:hypothetical protein
MVGAPASGTTTVATRRDVHDVHADLLTSVEGAQCSCLRQESRHSPVLVRRIVEEAGLWVSAGARKLGRLCCK